MGAGDDGGEKYMRWLFIGFVKAWRAIVSPWYAPCCKYYPSCSAYALEALELNGALKGVCQAVSRLLRCNPWSNGGFDPVPGSPLEARAALWWADETEDLVEDLQVSPGPSSAPAVMG